MPLHTLIEHPELAASRRHSSPVHVHYHWLFNHRDYESALALLQELDVGRDRLEWLAERLPLQ